MTDLINALLLGIIEGITEFLPISSTGHLLIAEHWLGARTDLFKNVLTSTAGEFRFQGLTPGNYKLFAWEEVENGAWLNAEFMRKHEERGVSVVITESNTERVDLKVISN